MAESVKRSVVYRVTPADGETKVLQKGERITIGRGPANGIVLRHASVSRHHATLRWEEGDDLPVLIDEGSANGVFLEGDVVEEWVPIGTRSQVEIGDVAICVEPSVIAVRPGSGRVAQGTFDDPAKIHRILLRLEEKGQSGVLRIAGGSARFELSIRAGRIVAATSPNDDSEPTGILKRALTLESGGYRFSLKGVPAGPDDFDLSPRAFVQLECGDPSKSAHHETARWARVSNRIETMLTELKGKSVN